jgi:hypothetical protein
VVDPTTDQPVKFDGLMGVAVIRKSATAVVEYSAISVQADPLLSTGSKIDTSLDAQGHRQLPLDGFGGHYLTVTGSVTGNVTYDDPGRPARDVTHDNPGPPAPRGTQIATSLIMLTLDVRTNQPNRLTSVDLRFYNEDGQRFVSTSVRFRCWGRFQLSTDIDRSLTRARMQSRVGTVYSGQAFKLDMQGIDDPAHDETGAATLLGLVETDESPVGVTGMMRTYGASVDDTSEHKEPVSSMFVPMVPVSQP